MGLTRSIVPDSDAQILADLVAADGTTGGFLKDSDMATGTWTPTFAIGTPGNFAGTVTPIGAYFRIGSLVYVQFDLTFSAFSHSSASGTVTITGLPFTVSTGIESWGAMQWSGITKTNYTNIVCRATSNTTTLDLLAMGSGQANATLSITDFPTGGSVRLKGAVLYVRA